MRKIALQLTLIAFAAVSLFAASATVTKVKDGGATVYKSELSEDKQSDVSGDQEVTMLKRGKNRSLVRTAGGIKGWVDNERLQILKITGGGRHDLSDVEVVGWLDNPAAVYILDNTNPDLNAMPLDRTFADEIVEPKDRESVERQYDEN